MAIPTRPGRTRKAIKRGPGQRIVEGKSFRLADAVRYIQRRAADRDGRIVAIGQLVLFSTKTGDAWLLDPTDQLAARLARGGRRSRSTSRKPIPPSPLVGRAAIASKARHSSTRITTPAVSPRSSGTRSMSSIRRLDREISNVFG